MAASRPRSRAELGEDRRGERGVVLGHHDERAGPADHALLVIEVELQRGAAAPRVRPVVDDRQAVDRDAGRHRLVTRVLASPADLQAHPLIGWEAGAAGINAADWLSGIAPDLAFVYRSSSLVNQLHAAKAGIGLAVLPCYLGDLEPEVARALPDPVPELARELWIVTHSDLKRTARVRAFFDVVGAGLAADRALFEGGEPGRRQPQREAFPPSPRG